jgi:hypothetical protein
MENWVSTHIGEKKHQGKENTPTIFQENPVLKCSEIKHHHHHLQPNYIFLKIYDVGISNFWLGQA